MTRGKTMRATAAITAVFFLSAASPALAANSVLLSTLLPGLGQAQEGHYGRATVFASAAIVSWVGLFASQINYSRSVEKYEDEKRTYLAYQTQIDNGHVVSIEDVDATRTAMTEAFDQADEEVVWRNVFLGAVVATYTLNLIDVIRSKPDTGEMKEPPAVSLEVEREGFRLVRTIRF